MVREDFRVRSVRAGKVADDFYVKLSNDDAVRQAPGFGKSFSQVRMTRVSARSKKRSSVLLWS